MKILAIDNPPSAAGAVQALRDVIEHIGDDDFVPSLMAFCRDAVGASDCSFFVHGRDSHPVRLGTARLPGLRQHNIGDCYVRDGYYRVDPATQATQTTLQAGNPLLLSYLQRDELPDHQWVHDYEAVGLHDRLSLLVAVDNGWGVLNAYRPERCAVSLDSAIQTLGSHGWLVGSALRRHAALAAPSRKASHPFDVLSARERQVVEGILEGLSAKESARRLGLSPTSIATYRQRAFEKLGIQKQVQLARLLS